MANLVIDIGNSYTKIAVFNTGELMEVKSYRDVAENVIDGAIARYQLVKAIISSVKKKEEAWEQHLYNKLSTLRFNAAMAKSIHNHYKPPQTLGLDRVAALAGAHSIYPGMASLVIDAGTCITYDLVDEGGNYYGGSISPGLNMRYKALNYYTDSLPMVEPDAAFTENAGADTVSALRSGVQNGIKFEMLGFINALMPVQKPTNIILTGGDSIFFDTLLKNSIFAPHVKTEPYLVLKGLNAVIQQHND